MDYDKIIIKPLGAGCEVGRSCIHVKYKERELLLDCGVHPAYTGISSLPFLDLIDLSHVEAILVTHFHLDHAAALPFLTEKTGFKGRVYMTHPTKAILKWLLNDFIRVINSSSDQDFYTEEDLEKCYNRIIPVDYHQEFDINGIKVTALNAGHVLGAAMFLIEIENSKMLYTGDFSREEDRHLRAAESPGCKLDALITESTYGVQCHLPRSEREYRFTSTISSIVERGGRCLLPVFALGRAQELLLILEEHWEMNKNLHGIPIYYVSALARRCMTVYQAYVNMMNERIQKISLRRNPFNFKHVQNLKDMQSFKDVGPCVMMASPGMLQSGCSRDLFERWCSERRNGVVIPGYCVEGTLAKEILSEPKEVESSKGGMLKLNMSVEYISFSAHVDYTQNSQFIDECSPDNLFFVHGELNEMMRLKNSINMRNEKRGIVMNLFSLKNGEEGSFVVRKNEMGRVYTDKQEFEGIIVNENGIKIYERGDIKDSNIKELRFRQKQEIPYNSTYNLVKEILLTEYNAEIIEDEEYINYHSNGSLNDSQNDSQNINRSLNDSINDSLNDSQNINRSQNIKNCKRFYLKVNNIKIELLDRNIVLEWECNYLDDVIAMGISKSIKDLGEGVKSIRYSKKDKIEILVDVLKGYYKSVERIDNIVHVSWKDKKANISDSIVEGNDDAFVASVREIVLRVNLICCDDV